MEMNHSHYAGNRRMPVPPFPACSGNTALMALTAYAVQVRFNLASDVSFRVINAISKLNDDASRLKSITIPAAVPGIPEMPGTSFTSTPSFSQNTLGTTVRSRRSCSDRSWVVRVEPPDRSPSRDTLQSLRVARRTDPDSSKRDRRFWPIDVVSRSMSSVDKRLPVW